MDRISPAPRGTIGEVGGWYLEKSFIHSSSIGVRGGGNLGRKPPHRAQGTGERCDAFGPFGTFGSVGGLAGRA